MIYTKLMKVWLSREDGCYIDIDLPTNPAYINNAICSLTEGCPNKSVYISDYEYLIPHLSYEDGEQMHLVDQFTSIFDLNKKLNNIMDSYSPESAIALLIADMMRSEDLNSVENIDFYIGRYEPVPLDPDIFNYNPKCEEEYYWYILDVSHPNLSDTISSTNAEVYFDVRKFVNDMVLGSATVTSTGYLVWHF